MFMLNLFVAYWAKTLKNNSFTPLRYMHLKYKLPALKLDYHQRKVEKFYIGLNKYLAKLEKSMRGK